MNKKTQITMFVILGLVLLILVIMFFSFIRNFKPKPNSVTKIIDELETGRLKNHVTSCMAEVGAEGLEKLGANGGIIYDFEGGRIPIDNLVLGVDYLSYTSLDEPYFVAYGLKRNTDCGLIDYTISGYPHPGVSIDDLNMIYNDLRYGCIISSNPQSGYDGFFGQNVMNKLCYLARQSGCENFANGPVMGFTLQKQLEDYISRKLPLCIDFDAFTQRMAANITVSTIPAVETNIHDGDILLVTKYPITISFENQEPITQILSYQTTLNLRLARVYNFLHNVLLMESKVIDFNIETDYDDLSVSSYWKQGIELKRIRAPCVDCEAPYKYDDIIEVTDRESIVKGKPFIFRTAIENRRPVLDLIPDQEINSINDILQVPLRAQDPDDAQITYYFLSYGYGRENCQSNGAAYGGGGGGYGAGAGGYGAGGAGYGPPVPGPEERWCARTPNIITSDPVPVLSIPITEYDVGKHPVGILAVDETGLFDYQNFDISVELPFTQPASDIWLQRCNDYFRYGFISQLEDFPPPFNNSDSYDSALASYCEMWCRVAANQCESVCNIAPDDPGASYWGLFEDTNCKRCITPLVHSEQHHQNRGCGYYSGESCILQMPVCLWIRAYDLGWSSFYESCFDDPFFDTITPPAYIITD